MPHRAYNIIRSCLWFLSASIRCQFSLTLQDSAIISANIASSGRKLLTHYIMHGTLSHVPAISGRQYIGWPKGRNFQYFSEALHHLHAHHLLNEPRKWISLCHAETWGRHFLYLHKGASPEIPKARPMGDDIQLTVLLSFGQGFRSPYAAVCVTSFSEWVSDSVSQISLRILTCPQQGLMHHRCSLVVHTFLLRKWRRIYIYFADTILL